MLPGVSIGQEAALTHLDVDTLHTAIPEHKHTVTEPESVHECVFRS